MTEVVEKKYVPVTFPARSWTPKECAAFEEFVRINGADIRRIFIKYSITKQ